jgi:Crp-like helix-turn-helix domain
MKNANLEFTSAFNPNTVQTQALKLTSVLMSADLADKVICVCAPERHKAAIAGVCEDLGRAGCVAISIDSAALECVDVANHKKLALCDELFVINLNGYLDEHTRTIVVAAQHMGKSVKFIESLDLNELNQAPVRVSHKIPEDTQSIEKSLVIDLSKPFQVTSGAVMLYGPNETRPAFTLISDHIWPGIAHVPEVWYAQAASNTQIVDYTGDAKLLKPLGEVIRWAVATSGQISERMLWALLVLGSVETQEELSAIVGCRRESVTAAMRKLRQLKYIEKSQGRIRLTSLGICCATKLSSFERDEVMCKLQDYKTNRQQDFDFAYGNQALAA